MSAIIVSEEGWVGKEGVHVGQDECTNTSLVISYSGASKVSTTLTSAIEIKVPACTDVYSNSFCRQFLCTILGSRFSFHGSLSTRVRLQASSSSRPCVLRVSSHVCGP